jgi:Mg-chelatase subunit ChlD
MALRASQLLFGAVLACGLCLPERVVPQSRDVDLALILAIDCSFSVDSAEFRLQMEGMGQALQDPSVLKAIKLAPQQRIAIAAFQWSDKDNQFVILPWTVIANEADANAAGKVLETMPRQLAEGGTSISSALRFGYSLFSEAPIATRRVIDLSTDGRNNIGPPVPLERDFIVRNSVTINALVIANEFPELDRYAERQIVGGTGNFVVKAQTYDDYGAAMLRKLIKEITGPGTT